MILSLRRIALAAALAWIAAPCQSIQAQALVNGSFEDEEPDATINIYKDMPAGWGRWGNWMNRETQWMPTHSGHCLMGYHHWRVAESNSSGIFQDIAGVAPGTRCTFSVYVYKDTDTNGDSVELRLEQYGGFKMLASRTFPMAQLPPATWKQLSLVGTNELDGIRVFVAIKPRPTTDRKGAIKLDDAAAVFEKVASKTP